ncbi:MAG: hypothetical protein DRJ01_14235 [Bacteroidetes bacterium]|nr:MAG: hypothetical protein DRJ01_14235 [Bacteroidota bacterium]
MNKKEIQTIVFISYIITAILSFMISILVLEDGFLNNLLSSIKITTILSLWWLYYFKIGWKQKPINKLFKRANLNGTWFGHYESYDIEKDKIFKGEIGLKINQDFTTISLISYSNRFSNYSYNEILNYEEKSDRYAIVYVYTQTVNNAFDLKKDSGTSELILKEAQNKLILEGEFWTSHNSKGKLKVEKIANKKIDTFEEASELFQSRK